MLKDDTLNMVLLLLVATELPLVEEGIAVVDRADTTLDRTLVDGKLLEMLDDGKLLDIDGKLDEGNLVAVGARLDDGKTLEEGTMLDNSAMLDDDTIFDDGKMLEMLDDCDTLDNCNMLDVGRMSEEGKLENSKVLDADGTLDDCKVLEDGTLDTEGTSCEGAAPRLIADKDATLMLLLTSAVLEESAGNGEMLKMAEVVVDELRRLADDEGVGVVPGRTPRLVLPTSMLTALLRVE